MANKANLHQEYSPVL